MPLPNGERAVIDPRKISAYLLSVTHPIGRHKWRFFQALGFSPDDFELVRDALRAIALSGTVVQEVPAPFGRRYIVDGTFRESVPSPVEELETVVLTRDLPRVRLRTGDIGAIVHRYAPGGYEVEFVTGGGDTLAVLTLSDADVRPLAAGEILHARRLGLADAS